MNQSGDNIKTAKVLEVEVLPSQANSSNQQGHSDSKETNSGSETFFLPQSGLAILAIDWIIFGLNAPTLFVFMLLACMAAFVLTFGIVFWLQLNKAGDRWYWALFKALLGAIAAGVPFPVAGTMIGGLILLLSGIKKKLFANEVI